MNVHEELVQAVSQQIEFSLAASYLYLQMKKWFIDNGMEDAAEWIGIRAEGESRRAMLLFNHLLSGGHEFRMDRIPAVRRSFRSGEELAAVYFRHEQRIEDCLRELRILTLAAGWNQAWLILNRFVELPPVPRCILKLAGLENGAGEPLQQDSEYFPEPAA